MGRKGKYKALEDDWCDLLQQAFLTSLLGTEKHGTVTCLYQVGEVLEDRDWVSRAQHR